MWKKLGVIIAVIGILASYSFASIFTSPTTKVFSGATNVSIPMTFNAETDNVSAFNSTMQYDSTKLIFKGLTTSVADKQIVSNQVGPGQLRFIMYGLNSTSIASGAMVNVVFDVIQDSSGQLSVTFVDTVGATPEATSVLVSIEPIVFDIVLKGDINSDGLVNSTDVMAIVGHVLGTSVISVADGDINDDGSINVIDMQALIKIILG